MIGVFLVNLEAQGVFVDVNIVSYLLRGLVIDVGRRRGGRDAGGGGPHARLRVVERLVVKAIGRGISVVGIGTLVGVIEGDGMGLRQRRLWRWRQGRGSGIVVGVWGVSGCGREEVALRWRRSGRVVGLGRVIVRRRWEWRRWILDVIVSSSATP